MYVTRYLETDIKNFDVLHNNSMNKTVYVIIKKTTKILIRLQRKWISTPILDYSFNCLLSLAQPTTLRDAHAN